MKQALRILAALALPTLESLTFDVELPSIDR